MDVNKKFGLMLGGVLLGVSIYNLIMHHQHLWLLIIFSCLLLLMSLIKPDALAPFRLAWDKVGAVLGTINSTILLTLVFFILISPVALVLRWMRTDLLQLHRRQDGTTYWQPAAPIRNSTLNRQF